MRGLLKLLLITAIVGAATSIWHEVAADEQDTAFLQIQAPTSEIYATVWLVKDGRSWKVYDWESLDDGLRLSVSWAASMPTSGADMIRLQESRDAADKLVPGV